MLSRALGLVAVVLALSAIASSCGTRGDESLAPRRLIVGTGAVSGGNAGLFTAMELGLFDARGLEVEVADFTNATMCLRAMISGQVPLCAGTSGVALVNAVLAGADVVGIAALVDTMPYSLVVHPDVGTVAHLRGKRLGINDFGGTTEFATHAVLADAGLGPADVTLLQLGSQSSRLAALLAGRIEGTVITPPTTVLARRLGLRVLVDLAALGLEYPHDLVVVPRAMSRDHPETIRALLGAIIEGTRYFKAHKDEGTRILATHLQIEDRETSAEAYAFFARVISDTLRVSPAGIRTVLAEVTKTNAAGARADAEDFVETRFIREIQESGLLSHDDVRPGTTRQAPP